MDDHSGTNNSSSDPKSPGGSGSGSAEPVRSRWTPKPEQILILESIFNSGMVNPPKDETVRIRKLLEKFGAVGDANVFYWFQNRRSRSRRRQRQLQASAAAAAGLHQPSTTAVYDVHRPSCTSTSTSSSSGSSGGGFYSTASSSTSSSVLGEESADDLFSISRQMGFGMEIGTQQTPFYCSQDVSQLQYQAGVITVFINGIATEVPRGPIDIRAAFGQDVILVHSSGEIVPVNEFGILIQGLLMGESYFLVSRSN